MNRLLVGIAASAALLAAGTAKAAINVSLWTDQVVAAHNATLAELASLGPADATTTVSSINFATGNSDATSIDTFLGTAIGGAIGSHLLDNTVFLFTGSTFLNAGTNSFVVPHDDGLELHVNGIGTVLSQPGPTGEVHTPFDVVAPTAGLYSFQLAYGECCGGPAVLAFTVNSQPVTGNVPEPAGWALMLVGFGGLGAVLRRRRATLAAA